MLLTNLLLACGLSTAVGSGLALKENSNYLHHEKPQEQLYLDNKKNAVTGDLELDTWYDVDLESLGSFVSYNGTFNMYVNTYFYESCDIEEVNPGDNIALISGDVHLILYIDDPDRLPNLSLCFTTLPHQDLNSWKSALTLSDNQHEVPSTTEEVFDVVGDTTTGFVGVLTSAFAGMTSLIYNNGEFTILGVLLLIATGVSLVYWIFRLIRGVTSGVAR